VKINELKRTTLEEGFLDNLISKAQNMAGGDGVTGFIRALRGQGAALNKVADGIANQVEGPLLKQLGNSVQAIKAGQADVPVAAIIKLALQAGVSVSQADNNAVSAEQIVGYLRDNKQNVVQVAGGGINQVADTIATVATGGEAGPIGSMNFDQTIKNVSLAIASSIILLQADSENAGPFQVDPAEKQKFDQLGQQVIDTLFDPTSQDFRALKPNEALKDNLSGLVVHIINTVQNKLVDLPAERLQALAGNPPPIVTATQLKTLLAGHDASIDPNAVNNIVTKVTPLIQEQLKAWIVIAAKEPKQGKPVSFQLYKDWGGDAFGLIDNMKFGAGASAAGEAPAGSAQGAGNNPAASNTANAPSTAGTPATPSTAATASSEAPPTTATPPGDAAIFTDPAALQAEWQKFLDSNGRLITEPQVLELLKDMWKYAGGIGNFK
jgi:hypothetical protein